MVNFAAESHNSLAVVDPGLFARTNVLGTQLLLEAARRTGVARFHHVSTCEVYGDLPLDSGDAFTEESPYRPRTPYNASKAAADHYVRAYHETSSSPISITNCANNCGPFRPGEGDPALRHERARRQAAADVRVHAEPTRVVHVRDHCRAIDLVLQSDRVGETYNVGSRIEKSIEEIADVVVELDGQELDLKQIVPDRPGHDRRYLLDSSKLERELGWKPEIGFDEGLRETVEWYAENRVVGAAQGTAPGRRDRLALTTMSGAWHRTCPFCERLAVKRCPAIAITLLPRPVPGTRHGSLAAP